jgi:predicted aspartyl protease
MRAFGLEVAVNGERLRLLLDTGASGILIQQRAAERSGMDKLADASFGGIGDNVHRGGGYSGMAARVTIEGVEFRDAIVNVSDKDIVGYADGLIGTDVFSRFLVEVDFPARKLRLTPLPGYDPAAPPRDRTTPSGGFTPVFRFGHMLLIPTRVNDAPERLFVIDSGAARTMVSYDLAAELGHLKRDESMRLSGASGQVADIYATGTVLLQFAGFRQKNLGMTAFDTREQSRRLGVELSGFLGLPLLNLFRLAIDYRDGFVKFDFPAR